MLLRAIVPGVGGQRLLVFLIVHQSVAHIFHFVRFALPLRMTRACCAEQLAHVQMRHRVGGRRRRLRVIRRLRHIDRQIVRGLQALRGHLQTLDDVRRETVGADLLVEEPNERLHEELRF